MATASLSGPRQPPRHPDFKKLLGKEESNPPGEAKADDLPRVLLKTNNGDIELELFENEAPNTVANFISLVEKGFYNGADVPPRAARFHGPGRRSQGRWLPAARATRFADECHRPDHRLHFRGTLSMANAGRDTGGSQFFLSFIPTGTSTASTRFSAGWSRASTCWPSSSAAIRRSSLRPDKILEAKVLRKRNHPYQPKTMAE